MAPAFKWFRVVAFFSLLVMTTAMAASPVRQTVLPLVAKSFARWSGNMTPAVSPLVTSAGESRPSAMMAMAPLTPLSEPDRFTVTTGPSATSSITPADRFDYRAAAAAPIQDELTPDQLAALASKSGSRFNLGPWQPGGGSSRGGAASLARGGKGSPANAGGGSRQAAAGASASVGGVGNGGARTPGAGQGGGRQTVPPPVPGNAGSVLNQHTNGLPVLNAGGAGAAGGMMTVATPTVAANPEPSTLLLLGTGLLAAAAVRRRRAHR